MGRTVAIVGRPNVGKSRLFNRLAGRRIAIVHDQPGITRDIVSAEVGEGGYTLLDTGGLGLKDAGTPVSLTAAAERQAEFAISAAHLILFVTDGRAGVAPLDERIAERLRRSGKPVILVVNKVDVGDEPEAPAEFHALGLGEPLAVSAEHGRGEDALRSAIAERLAAVAPERAAAGEPAGGIRFCFVGRPNVGKSSLANRLLASDRLIVSDIPGTTRDAVEVPFEFRGRDGRLHPFRLIDTAGIRAATKLASPVEYFARLRSLEAIQRADVVFLVLDAADGVTQQDKAIAGEAIKERRPVVVVVNKWDLAREAFARGGSIGGHASERDYRESYGKALFERLFFTPGAPVVFVSALSGYEVDRMLNAAVRLHRTADQKLPTARLNQTLIRLTDRTPPPAVGARRFRIYYATQTGNRPFRIRMFCNRAERLTEAYRRYLEAGLVEEFHLNGCPIVFDLVGKERGGAEPESRSAAAD